MGISTITATTSPTLVQRKQALNYHTCTLPHIPSTLVNICMEGPPKKNTHYFDVTIEKVVYVGQMHDVGLGKELVPLSLLLQLQLSNH